jgi:hypothetical protein
LVNPDAHAIGSPTDGPGEKGPGTKEDGYLAYYEVCKINHCYDTNKMSSTIPVAICFCIPLYYLDLRRYSE